MKAAKEINVFICDDIRQEVGNKISLMGIYAQDLILPEIPFSLPKLCILIIAKNLNSKIRELKVVIKNPDSTTISPPSPNQKVPQNLQMGITLAPFNVNQEGETIVEIYKNSESTAFFTHSFFIKKAQ